MPKHFMQCSIRAYGTERERETERDGTFFEEQDMEIFQILPIPNTAHVLPTKQNKKQRGVLTNILYIWFGFMCTSTKGRTITTAESNAVKSLVPREPLL